MARVVVIGAGVGGLATAIATARRGHDVTVFEARDTPGGLASRVTYDGLEFDAGPYVLLDRPGLAWAFDRLGLDVDRALDLRHIDAVYEVAVGDDHRVRIDGDPERTADRLDEQWPGSGDRYRSFVERTTAIHERARPLQWTSDPGLRDLLSSGAWRDVPFLLRSLGSVLDRTGLPAPVCRALSIWTSVAGQSVDDAPSPLALVPSLIHGPGAYYPRGGISTVPAVLAYHATALGVEFEYGRRATSIDVTDGTATGVTLADGESVPADAVVSNYSGIGTYLELVEDLPDRVRRRLDALPLQSPGACAYLRVAGRSAPPYLRFRLDDERPDSAGPACRAFVQPGILDPDRGADGYYPARLIVPLAHDRATAMDPGEQAAVLDDVLAEDWWQDLVEDWEVLSTRVVDDWGAEFNLFRKSMNPVMTASFMRRGRMDHRSPYVDRLYLTGSSTHPGQWVSFCAVSGVHAASVLERDLP